MSTRAGCYARKSTSEEGKDADAKSCARQVQGAREFAASKGWLVDDDLVFQDQAISGAEFKRRPGLARLLTTIETKPFDVLIVSEQSRLGRDTIRTLALIRDLQDAELRIFAYLDGEEITVEGAMREVKSFMASYANSEERKATSQRVRDQKRAQARAGKSTGGTVYGLLARSDRLRRG